MLINKNLIVIDLAPSDKIGVIEKMAAYAFQEGKISSIGGFVEDVLEREKTYSTGIGEGIAIPHGKSKYVKEAVIVFGKTKVEIQWDSIDGKPVDMVFLLGVPEENVNNLHLKLLSQLSRKLMDEEFVTLLRKAVDTEEVFEALKGIEVSN